MADFDGGVGERGAHSPWTVLDAGTDLLRYAQSDHPRFGTGWSVDDVCGCVGAGELALWVARSGCGKSTAYLNVIRNTPDVPTMVVNMEMTPRRQVEWLLSMTYDLETPSRDIEDVLRIGDDDSRYDAILASLDNLSYQYPNLHFVTPTRPTVSDLCYVLDDIEDQTGVRPVRMFVDHLGLMGGTDDFTGHSKVTSGLHSMAIREDLAIYALQQTKRGGDGGSRNDGHMPITMSSGRYGGEEDADWVFGLYRPDRNPKFGKSRYQFDDPNDYFSMIVEREQVKGISVLQVVKNRPYGDLLEDGLELKFDAWTRRLTELGSPNQ